jgi:hypothetical protein
MAQANSYASKSPVAAADKVLVLDSAASNAIKQATLADVRQLATYRQSVTLANNATSNLNGGVTFAGLMIVANDSGGPVAMFLVNYFNVIELSDSSNVFSVAAGTASSNNVSKAGLGAAIVLENKTGSTATYSILIIPLQ